MRFKSELTLDGDDELWDDWKDLGSTLFKHIEGSLHREESVWVLLLTDALEEDGEVMMVVKGHDVDLPEKLVGGTVINGDWEITPVVETAEFGCWNGTSVGCSCFRFGYGCLLLWLSQRGGLSTETFSFFECDTCT